MYDQSDNKVFCILYSVFCILYSFLCTRPTHQSLGAGMSHRLFSADVARLLRPTGTASYSGIGSWITKIILVPPIISCESVPGFLCCLVCLHPGRRGHDLGSRLRSRVSIGCHWPLLSGLFSSRIYSAFVVFNRWFGPLFPVHVLLTLSVFWLWWVFLYFLWRYGLSLGRSKCCI